MIQIIAVLLVLAMTALWLYDVTAILRAVRGWVGL